MKRVCVKRLMNALAATGAAGVDTSTLTDLGIILVYDRVSGSGAGTMTFYGSDDTDGTNKYLLGIRQSILGTLDANSAITYSTDATEYYSVDGVHSCIYLSWVEDTNPATITAYVIGLEDRDGE